MCIVTGSKQAKLKSYAPGSGPYKVWGLDADTGGPVAVYFNQKDECYGKALGKARIFFLRSRDYEDIIDAIDGGHAIEFWGKKEDKDIRITLASKKEVAR